MRPISKRRFECLAGYIRNPSLLVLIEELEWFSSENERVLGLLSRDRLDDDFGWVALGRDEQLRFRAVDVGASVPSSEQAREVLRETVDRLALAPDEEFHQSDQVRDPVDFFADIGAGERLHPTFRILRDEPRYAPAKAAIAAMMRFHEDLDGNFVQQLQTSGFDARLWELYLYAMVTELGFARVANAPVPDLVVRSPFGSVAIEAVTSNPPHNVVPQVPNDLDGLLEYQRTTCRSSWRAL